MVLKERITLSSGSIAIQQIKCTPGNTFYLLDSELTAGLSYPLFEQLVPVDLKRVPGNDIFWSEIGSGFESRTETLEK